MDLNGTLKRTMIAESDCDFFEIHMKSIFLNNTTMKKISNTAHSYISALQCGRVLTSFKGKNIIGKKRVLLHSSNKKRKKKKRISPVSRDLSITKEVLVRL